MDTTTITDVAKNIATGEITVLINAVITAAFIIYKFYRRLFK